MSGGSSGNIEGTMKPKQTRDEKAALEFTDSWTFEPELLSAAAGCHSGCLSKQSTCCMFRSFRSAARL